MAFIIAKEACRRSIIVIGFGESCATLGTFKLNLEPSKKTLTMINMEARRFIIAGATDRWLVSTIVVRLILKAAPADAAVDLFSLGRIDRSTVLRHVLQPACE